MAQYLYIIGVKIYKNWEVLGWCDSFVRRTTDNEISTSQLEKTRPLNIVLVGVSDHI